MTSPEIAALIVELRDCADKSWPFAKALSNLGKPETDNNFGRAAVAMRKAADALESLRPKPEAGEMSEDEEQKDVRAAWFEVMEKLCKQRPGGYPSYLEAAKIIVAECLALRGEGMVAEYRAGLEAAERLERFRREMLGADQRHINRMPTYIKRAVMSAISVNERAERRPDERKE